MINTSQIQLINDTLVSGINLSETIKNSSLTVNLILLFLIVISAVSWGIIVYKFIQYRKAVLETEQFVSFFWKKISHDEIMEKAKNMKESPVAQVFKAGYNELNETRESWESKGIAVVGTKVEELTENVQRAMFRESHSKNQVLESKLQFLATTASASPFIGLFGTVYGIMNAFQVIAKTGSATLGSIAPHLSEALVTTAFGLIAAIPATIFFNYFNSQLQRFDNEAMNITTDFVNQVKRNNV